MHEYESRREKLKREVEEGKQRLEPNNTEAVTDFTESKTSGIKEICEKVNEVEKYRKQKVNTN